MWGRTWHAQCNSGKCGLWKLHRQAAPLPRKMAWNTKATSHVAQLCQWKWRRCACHEKLHYHLFWNLQNWDGWQLSRQARSRNETIESRRDMLRSSKRLLYFVRAPFPTSFLHESQNLPPQNRCFVQGLRQFSAHVTQFACCQAQATPHVAAQNEIAALATKHVKMVQKYCACHAERFWRAMKHAGMSRSATLATRNQVMQRFNPPKVTDHIAQSSQTVADGCGRLRRQKQRRANTSLRIREETTWRSGRVASQLN